MTENLYCDRTGTTCACAELRSRQGRATRPCVRVTWGLGARDRTVHATQLACHDRDFSVTIDWSSDHNKKKKKNLNFDPREMGRHNTSTYDLCFGYYWYFGYLIHCMKMC